MKLQWKLRKTISLTLFSMIVLILIGLFNHQTKWLPLQTLATKVYLPIVLDNRTPVPTAHTPDALSSPEPLESASGTPTATPLPTFTPYPTVDLNELPVREGPRPDERPDLSVSAIRLIPAYPAPGEEVTVEVEVENSANGAVPNVELGLLLREGEILTQRFDIAATSTKTLQFSWSPTQPGLYALNATIDPNQELLERNRTDNSLAEQFAVAVATDSDQALAISDVRFVSSEEAATFVEITIQNKGDAGAQVPLVLRNGNEVVATELVGPFAAQDALTVKLPWAAVDMVHFSAELDPRRHTGGAEPLNVTVYGVDGATDLRVEGLSISAAQVVPNEPRQVTLNLRIVNAGNEAITTPFRTSIFPGELIRNPDRRNPELATHYLTIDQMAPGEAIYVARTVVLPEDIHTFDAQISVDADHVVDETDEQNNLVTAHYKNPTPDVNRWISIGPTRITDSTRHGYGWNDATGRLSTIAIDPTNSATIYVGAQGSGVWKSVTGGTSWYPIADTLPTLNVAALALDPTNPARLYMVSSRDGVFRTDNGGTSWRQLSSQDLRATVHGGVLLIDPLETNRLYVATGTGVHRSTDGGVTWNATLSGGGVTGLVLDPANVAHLYAALYHESSSEIAGVYESWNNGQTWRKLQGCPQYALPTNTTKAKISLAMAQGKLFAGYKTAASFQLYRKTSTGCSVGGRTESVWDLGWETTTNHGVIWSGMWADPTDARYLYLGGTYFWRSTDGGTTFQVTSGLGPPSQGAHVDHHGFAVDPQQPSTIYTLNDGGIYRSTAHGQQGTWQFVGNGLAIVEFYDHADATTAPQLLIGGTQDNGTLKYDGNSTVWTMIRGGDGATTDIDPTNAQILYAMNQYARSIARSTDGGNTFQSIANGLPSDYDCFNLPWHLHPKDPSIMLAPCNGNLWRTATVPPGDWQIIFQPPSGGLVRSAVDPSADLYYAGANNGIVYAGPSGANWREVFRNPTVPASVTDMEVDLNRTQQIYVSFGHQSGNGRIFLLTRTSNTPAALNAVDMTSDLPGARKIQTLAVDRMHPYTVYVGTQKGVYRGRSTDNGATWYWRPYSNGMPAVDVRDLEVHPVTGVMRAITHGRSAYEVNTDYPIGSLLGAVGKVTFLRVHDVGTAYGPPSDRIDVEVVIQLDTMPGKAFGFQLRTDANEFAHKGMLDLVRTAFRNDKPIRIDYRRTGLHNGQIIRVNFE